MSTRELAKALIDQIPESRLLYIISYLQGASIPDEIPNDETINAMTEVNEMIRTGTGKAYTDLNELWSDLEDT